MLRVTKNDGSFPKPLSAEDEKKYVELSAQGDMEARNILIEHNLRLVAHIIKKYYTQNGDQDDLISIGTIGLIKGISTYKPDKGVRLATYASRCIENAILSLRNHVSTLSQFFIFSMTSSSI
jgi:RNA polymerase sporulation-specific sigma factor